MSNAESENGSGTAASPGWDAVEKAFASNKKDFKREYGDVWRTAYLTAVATWLVVIFLAGSNCFEDTCGLSVLMTTGAFLFVLFSVGIAHWVSKRHFPICNAWIDAVARSEGLSPYNLSFYRLWLRRKGYVTLEEAKRFMVSERRHQKQRTKEQAWQPPLDKATA
ncbi:MAG: hypothetical protein WBP72_14680 [Rhodocyclaceae bacterium]